MTSVERKPEEFKKQAELKGIKEWRIHDCFMCNYSCGFVFHPGVVYYDNGCFCTGCDEGHLRVTSWDEVAQVYNMQQVHPPTAAKNAEFWGFPEGGNT